MVDLRALDLRPGEVRRVELDLPQAPLELGGQTYVVEPATPRALRSSSRASPAAST